MRDQGLDLLVSDPVDHRIQIAIFHAEPFKILSYNLFLSKDEHYLN